MNILRFFKFFLVGAGLVLLQLPGLGPGPAWAQTASSPCASTIVNTAAGPTLRVPYLIYQDRAYTIDLVIDSGSTGGTALRAAGATPLASTAAVASCIPATLTSDFFLNLPHLDFLGASYSLAMQLDLARFPAEFVFNVTSLFPIRFITQNTQIQGNLSIAASEMLIVNNSASPEGTTINVAGDFECRGPLEVFNNASSLRIVVTGKVTLACPLRFAGDSPNNRITIIAGGAVSVLAGFSTPSSGHVIVTDDESLIRSPDAYASDATQDDGVTPSIMPVPDTEAQAAPVAGALASGRVQAQAADCVSVGTHRLQGDLAPPPNRRLLSQRNFDGAATVLATWFKCNVELRDVKVDPPRWDDPPRQDAADQTARNGRKGQTLNLYSGGKITFAGNSTFTLMDGGKGQDKSVVGNPASATAGNGGASGDLKIAAAGGIDFATGATLTIIPGKGGDGGNATATGTAGANGCPGLPGGNASAVGGAGADSKKVLRARGFDPTGKVIIGQITGGAGGQATATAGKGGDGNAGTCNGGAGGEAGALGGKGGAASFRYTGAGAVTARTVGGAGGAAKADAGAGGNGGNRANRCEVGGDGAKGGNGTARGGLGGTGATDRGADGAAQAANGHGTGGLCGDWRSVNGMGGAWAEFFGGVQTGAGLFASGAKDCACVLAGEPKISLTPGELQFNHSIGGSSCPQTIGSVVIGNGGGGNFTWRLGTLPAWLSANKTSGNAGDSVQFSFTCTGFTETVNTSVSITGTNSANGQPLAQPGALNIGGTVR